MRESTLVALLEAFAVGDALGMPTEFMRRADIVRRYGLVDRILDPSISWTHPDLPFASVTDDTEQVFRLIVAYAEKGISVGTTVETLLAWVRETDAVAKRYIGPSSLKALTAIENGADPREAGKSGTTCGGIMRSPAAVLAACAGGTDCAVLAGGGTVLAGGGAVSAGSGAVSAGSGAVSAGGGVVSAGGGAVSAGGGAVSAGDGAVEALEAAVLACCVPTHNTRSALEAAMAYSYALFAALRADCACGEAGTAGSFGTAGVANADGAAGVASASPAAGMVAGNTATPSFARAAGAAGACGAVREAGATHAAGADGACGAVREAGATHAAGIANAGGIANAAGAARAGDVFESILDAAIAGAARGAELALEGFPGPSSGARIAHLRAVASAWRNADEAMDFLYGVIGTGIESADVCAAVFGIFLFARGDVMLALRMGASMGGDTDTIAALAGALCAAFAGGHNIPRDLVDTVVDANTLKIREIASSLSRSRP